ncbi:MAG TPA: response regulator [Gemmataceae bacterium]|nr:response regulator [Gemmataceae bacterium]
MVANSERQPAAALRVLVVEDDADTARTWVWLLEAMGHQVEVARDGPAALQAAEANRPDAVLLDLGLPGLSGYEVAQQLRQQQTGAARPLIIAVTGLGEYTQRLRSYEVGIDLHLVKPVNPEELKGFLNRYQNAYHPGR